MGVLAYNPPEVTIQVRASTEETTEERVRRWLEEESWGIKNKWLALGAIAALLLRRR